jgi:hypothetical protein
MKKNTLITIFLLFVPFIFISASTFPEDEAGISAYVELDDVSDDILLKIHNVLLDKKSGGSNHIIGRTEIEMNVKNPEGDEDTLFELYPYIYADIDGWLVAYFPKEDPSSKLMWWNNYSPESELSTTVLKEAIDQVIIDVNSDEDFNIGYSEDVNYYHFQHSDANRMTIITDTVYMEDVEEPDYVITTNNFSVKIPGTVHETSYSLYYSDSLSGSGSIGAVSHCTIRLEVDESEVEEKGCFCCSFPNNLFIYEFYPDSTFSSETPHSVVVEGTQTRGGIVNRMGAATALIYQVD